MGPPPLRSLGLGLACLVAVVAAVLSSTWGDATSRTSSGLLANVQQQLTAAMATGPQARAYFDAYVADMEMRVTAIGELFNQLLFQTEERRDVDGPVFNATRLHNARRTVICSYGADGQDAGMSLKRIYTGALAADPSARGTEARPAVAEAYGCVSVVGNRIERIGNAQHVEARQCKREQRRDRTACYFVSLGPGQSVVPGLHDAHGHLLDLGWARSAVDLVGATSVDEVVKRIEGYIESRPDIIAEEGRWISGLGWDQTKWDPPVFPSAADLSRASPMLARRRIVLRRIDVHALSLSEAALAAVDAAGVLPPAGQEIEGGLIARDAQGKPTGVFVDKAMDFVYKVMPAWTDDDRGKYLDAASQELLSLGITSVGDAAVDLATLDFYARRQDSSDGLPLRIYAMLACPPENPRCEGLAKEHGLPQVARPHSRDRLTVQTVKLFADGALGSWGSAMWEPYSDRQQDGYRGTLLIAEDDIYPLIQYWSDAGWQVATHCIGDRAQTLVLDAYERVWQGEERSNDPRFRIEHAQLLRSGDIPRFAKLGVIASMQPTHCTSDMGYVETRIGEQRAADGAHPWQSLLRANATLALGSDFPVEQPNVMHGLYSATTRKNPSGQSPRGPQGWYPEQRLSRAEALRGFTAAAAYAQFEESWGGTLHAGKRADLVVIDRDVVRPHGKGGCTDAQLRDARVLATVLDGRVVWLRESVR